MNRIFSGVQPSGNLHIGNYLGAIKNWVSLQKSFECIFCIVDLHALTVKQNPKELPQNTLEVTAAYIASGIDPEKTLIFNQSAVSVHAELTWLLSCITSLGWLNRMIQFKEKAGKKKENAVLGLYSYPVLMAADILLYQTDLVPVGADQKQHLELARDLANRFNTQYSETFKIPEPFIQASVSRIMSLQDPLSKMSKSDSNSNNFIALLDKPKIILKKIKRAVTDSGSDIKYNEKNNGISNLLTIYASLSGKSIKQIENDFDGKLYSDFKQSLGELTIETLRPIQEKYNDIINERAYLENILKENADKAYIVARKTLSKVHRKIGLIARG